MGQDNILEPGNKQERRTRNGPVSVHEGTGDTECLVALALTEALAKLGQNSSNSDSPSSSQDTSHAARDDSKRISVINGCIRI